ncbi:MAG: hypothetical protein IIC95_03090 [Chloroflexi bacterium]|nr:hypothetical protein [Chloroflexota bacterium]
MTGATPPYTEQRFIEDIREAFAAGKDARVQAQTIADRMRELFATGWPETSERFGKAAGSYTIHADADRGHPDPGFMVMVYRQGPQKAGVPSPHDHGTCFVVYGVAAGSNVQARYRWSYPEDTTQPPVLEEGPGGRPGPWGGRLLPPRRDPTAPQGSTTEATVYVRVTSQNLDDVWRHRYHLGDNKSSVFRSATQMPKA